MITGIPPRAKRRCSQCDDEFTPKTRAHRFCSQTCSAQNYRDRYVLAYSDKLSPTTKGVISELRVATDLMMRGYHVFRAYSAVSPWDLLVAIPDGRILKVEVKSAVIVDESKMYGSPIGPHNDGYDVIGYATPESIVYSPPIEEW